MGIIAARVAIGILLSPWTAVRDQRLIYTVQFIVAAAPVCERRHKLLSWLQLHQFASPLPLDNNARMAPMVLLSCPAQTKSVPAPNLTRRDSGEVEGRRS